MGENKQERWSKALSRVWDMIGGDCLVDECGEPDESASMHRKGVFEISADCYFEAYSGLNTEEVKEFRNRDRSKDEELMKLAFPYDYYGW